MWSFGYTTWVSEDGTDISDNTPVVRNDVYWGSCATFADSIRELYDNVQKLANDAEPYQYDHYAQVLADISDTKDDPGIMDDPDQWEDSEFTDKIGEIEYYVVFVN